MVLRIFLSFAFQDQEFVSLVYQSLSTQPDLEVYFFPEDKKIGEWRGQIKQALGKSQCIVFFHGAKIGETQHKEYLAFDLNEKRVLVVQFRDACPLPSDMASLGDAVMEPLAERSEATAERIAKVVINALDRAWLPFDGLPSGYVFAYEKDIIEAYAEGHGRIGEPYRRKGVPAAWPPVKVRRMSAECNNPLDPGHIGNFRPANAEILVDARARVASTEKPLTFPEAGPRARIWEPEGAKLRVGILVSGGIAPGINAVLSGIITRHALYAEKAGHSVRIDGLSEGLAGLQGDYPRRRMSEGDLVGVNTLGGSLLCTARFDALLETGDPAERAALLKKIVDALHNIDILYVIGGDGSMRAAHAIWSVARQRSGGHGCSVVGVPKTMDNDILWVWQSFGFMSAVERAKEFGLQLYTEARSNPRVCVMQLFGSDSGFVVSHAALASGVFDAVLIPEVPFSMTRLAEHVIRRLNGRYNPTSGPGGPYAMIMMAETAIPEDAQEHVDAEHVGLNDKEKEAIQDYFAADKRVRGQTPDELRTAGLKIVSRVLQKSIQAQPNKYWAKFRVFTNEPRHLIRSMRPTSSDVIYAQRLGALAVDNAMAGYTDFMVSQWLTEYVLVPLELVVLGRKRVPKDGIFWKSVLASTGQPDLGGP